MRCTVAWLPFDNENNNLQSDRQISILMRRLHRRAFFYYLNINAKVKTQAQRTLYSRNRYWYFFLKEEKKERVMVKMDNTLPKVWLFITVLVDFIYFSLPFILQHSGDWVSNQAYFRKHLLSFLRECKQGWFMVYNTVNNYVIYHFMQPISGWKMVL